MLPSPRKFVCIWLVKQYAIRLARSIIGSIELLTKWYKRDIKMGAGLRKGIIWILNDKHLGGSAECYQWIIVTADILKAPYYILWWNIIYKGLLLLLFLSMSRKVTVAVKDRINMKVYARETIKPTNGTNGQSKKEWKWSLSLMLWKKKNP